MWQDRQDELLRDEIEALLASLSDTAGFYDLVREPLTKARRGLAIEDALNRPWPLLPLIVCEAICGQYIHALSAAAAVQLLMAAGDVFDDIEDADSSESLSARYGSAVATNVATTLLILAERAIAQLKVRDVEDYIIVRVIDAVSSLYTTACAGQHLDLSLGPEMAVSEDVYLRVIDMKSASQIECACHIGALLANADQELINKFAMFGHNLGMAAQITNDYIISRTLPRPRDILDFCQKAIDQAQRNGHDIITAEDVLDAEAEFSESLFRSICLEYRTVYPKLEDVLLEFVEARHIMDWKEFEELGHTILARHRKIIDTWYGVDNPDIHYLSSVLFRIGFIGFAQSGRQFRLFADGRSFRETWSLVRPEPQVEIHPAFHRVIEIKVEGAPLAVARRRRKSLVDDRQMHFDLNVKSDQSGT